MWNRSSVEPQVTTDEHRTVYRALPPQHLLARQACTTAREQGALDAAIRIQRGRSGVGVRLEQYDDKIAFAFKQPRVQGDGRFSRAQPALGTLYAAYRGATALAERAFHHLRFIREQGGAITGELIPVIQIAFGLEAMPLVDLSEPPFAADLNLHSPGTDYAYTQDFADAARETSALGIVYPSQRDPERGSNIAVLGHEGLRSRRLDRRRVRDWFMSCNPRANTALLQTTQGETARFCFDAEGRPC